MAFQKAINKCDGKNLDSSLGVNILLIIDHFLISICMKKLHIAVLVCILACCMILPTTKIFSQSFNEPPVAPVLAQNLVTTQLEELVRLIDLEDLEHYGISSYSDVRKMTVGKVIYQMKFIDRDVISGVYSEKLQIGNIMVPIILDGAPLFFAYLSEMDGKLLVDGIGGHNEAKDWHAAFESIEEPYLIMLHTPVDHGDYLLHQHAGTFENISMLIPEQMPSGSSVRIPDIFDYYVQTAKMARAVEPETELMKEINK